MSPFRFFSSKVWTSRSNKAKLEQLRTVINIYITWVNLVEKDVSIKDAVIAQLRVLQEALATRDSFSMLPWKSVNEKFLSGINLRIAQTEEFHKVFLPFSEWFRYLNCLDRQESQGGQQLENIPNHAVEPVNEVEALEVENIMADIIEAEQVMLTGGTSRVMGHARIDSASSGINKMRLIPHHGAHNSISTYSLEMNQFPQEQVGRPSLDSQVGEFPFHKYSHSGLTSCPAQTLSSSLGTTSSGYIGDDERTRNPPGSSQRSTTDSNVRHPVSSTEESLKGTISTTGATVYSTELGTTVNTSGSPLISVPNNPQTRLPIEMQPSMMFEPDAHILSMCKTSHVPPVAHLAIVAVLQSCRVPVLVCNIKLCI
ncbi:hypothetical protein GALMADRAFT_214834 [Galerina marginata CBS 339.88]|uniref:Uncharacterized protein n=1 Tax=Galerina marginata (strain CBS 339.88) TaxID=685588 RepID=A0A067SJA0_GALM3|nr:hypothetical protein GALMADRAFT_214834 [Galerina marginata CBS 339.88]